MTDVLASIDHALAVQDATDFGDGDWLPGDPLYNRPRGWMVGEQTPRRMFDLLDDGNAYDDFEDRAWWATCTPCEVSWRGPDPCWVCGTERPRPYRSIPTQLEQSQRGALNDVRWSFVPTSGWPTSTQPSTATAP